MLTGMLFRVTLGAWRCAGTTLCRTTPGRWWRSRNSSTALKSISETSKGRSKSWSPCSMTTLSSTKECATVLVCCPPSTVSHSRCVSGTLGTRNASAHRRCLLCDWRLCLGCNYWKSLAGWLIVVSTILLNLPRGGKGWCTAWAVHIPCWSAWVRDLPLLLVQLPAVCSPRGNRCWLKYLGPCPTHWDPDGTLGSCC